MWRSCATNPAGLERTGLRARTTRWASGAGSAGLSPVGSACFGWSEAGHIDAIGRTEVVAIRLKRSTTVVLEEQPWPETHSNERVDVTTSRLYRSGQQRPGAIARKSASRDEEARKHSSIVDKDRIIYGLIARHWQASQDGDQDAEHDIYDPSAILDYPQSGERFRGRETIQAQRGSHPAERRFAVRRISGHADIWVSECVITYDGSPTYSVSIMEFEGDHVVHETQYFADPFDAATARAHLAERIPDIGK
jgi:hypothetical protein